MEYIILRGCDYCGCSISDSQMVCDACKEKRSIRELQELVETLPDHELFPQWQQELESLLNG